MSAPAYIPISCDFHSELELRALRRRPVEIRYRDDEGEKLVVAPVEDLYTRRGEEFMLLPGGIEIRLDRLISVDGLSLADFHC